MTNATKWCRIESHDAGNAYLLTLQVNEEWDAASYMKVLAFGDLDRAIAYATGRGLVMTEIKDALGVDYWYGETA